MPQAPSALHGSYRKLTHEQAQELAEWRAMFQDYESDDPRWLLVRNNLGLIVNIVKAQLTSSDSFADMLQGAMAEVIEKLPTYDPERAFVSTWLAYHARWGAQRAKQSDRYIPQNSLDAPMSNEDAQIYDLLPASSDTVIEGELNADAQLLHSLFDVLDRRERLFISLVYVDGLKHSDIAAMFNYSRERVRQILESAYSKLRDTAQERGVIFNRVLLQNQIEVADDEKVREQTSRKSVRSRVYRSRRGTQAQPGASDN